ncbi:unnamed protein product [Ectocarpus sp. 8 AP-2014]
MMVIFCFQRRCECRFHWSAGKSGRCRSNKDTHNTQTQHIFWSPSRECADFPRRRERTQAKYEVDRYVMFYPLSFLHPWMRQATYWSTKGAPVWCRLNNANAWYSAIRCFRRAHTEFPSHCQYCCE